MVCRDLPTSRPPASRTHRVPALRAGAVPGAPTAERCTSAPPRKRALAETSGSDRPGLEPEPQRFAPGPRQPREAAQEPLGLLPVHRGPVRRESASNAAVRSSPARRAGEQPGAREQLDPDRAVPHGDQHAFAAGRGTRRRPSPAPAPGAATSARRRIPRRRVRAPRARPGPGRRAGPARRGPRRAPRSPGSSSPAVIRIAASAQLCSSTRVAVSSRGDPQVEPGALERLADGHHPGHGLAHRVAGREREDREAARAQRLAHGEPREEDRHEVGCRERCGERGGCAQSEGEEQERGSAWSSPLSPSERSASGRAGLSPRVRGS